MAATARFITAGVVTAGIQTAYTAPSGTAVTIVHASLCSHHLSGTAGGPWSAHILYGPTASPAVWLPITAFSARQGLETYGPVTLPAAYGAVVISASTASVFTYFMAGLES